MAHSRSIPPSLYTLYKRSISLSDAEDVRWFEEHRFKLFLGAGVFFTIVLCSLVVVVYQQHQHSLALEALRLGIAALQAGQLAEAVPLLEKAEKSLGSGDQALVAKFYLSDAYARQGQSVRGEQISVDGLLPERGYIAQIVLVRQGKNAEEQNDHVTARKFYEDAARFEDGPLRADALRGLARAAEAMGEVDTAVAAREKFLTAYPNSPFADIVRIKLGK